MRRANSSFRASDEQERRTYPVLLSRAAPMFMHLPAARLRPFLAAASLVAVALASVACATGIGIPPAGAQDPAEGSSGTTEVTVPDEISSLNRDEVERRLGRLLSQEAGGIDGSLSAQGVEPTQEPDELTLQEILDLLDSDPPVSNPGEIVFSVSPQTLSGLKNPVLTIKTAPKSGKASVISPDRILYVPDDQPGDGDSFEYELFDGDVSVFSQVVELRP